MTTEIIVGLDEAGRGPLVGPVVAAAVILNAAQPIEGLTDSKKLSEKKRNDLFSCCCLLFLMVSFKNDFLNLLYKIYLI